MSPEGEIEGLMQTVTFRWPEDELVERVSVRLSGQIRFFETGGIYHVRFLFDGDPLCTIPLPIYWEDDNVSVSPVRDEAN